MIHLPCLFGLILFLSLVIRICYLRPWKGVCRQPLGLSIRIFSRFNLMHRSFRFRTNQFRQTVDVIDILVPADAHDDSPTAADRLRSLRLMPIDGFLGSFDVLLTATDGIDTVERTVTFVVQPNAVPEFPNFSLLATRSVTLRQQIPASDPDGDTVSFTLTDGPDGLSVLPSGRVVWTPPAETPLGDYTVEIVATDNGTPALSTSSQFTITVVPFDFGDAPDTYGTLLASDGARHGNSGPMLGSQRDTESDGLPSADAGAAGTTGDDGDGADDEDGVTFGTIRAGQLDATVTVNVQNAITEATLDAWIDFNGDGVWGGPFERIANSMIVTNGDNQISFDVPSWAHAGGTFARFRLSTVGTSSPKGAAADGEVEDYQLTISPPIIAGTFAGTPNVITNTLTGANSVFAADIDGDGDMDAVTTAWTGNRMDWFENDGTAGPWPTHSIHTGLTEAIHVFAADLDGDGDLDVVSASDALSRVSWYENTDGNGTFGTPQIISSSTLAARHVYPADIDGDGDLDIVTASKSDNDGSVNSGRIAWFENDGSAGGWTDRTILFDSTVANGIGSVAVADADGDGDLDVFASSFRDGKLHWLENNGSPIDGLLWTSHNIVTNAAASGMRHVLAADVDGDGDMDAVFASYDDDTIGWHENTNGLGVFGPRQVISNSADGAISVFVADINGDGNLDVASASSNDDAVVIHLNTNGLGTAWTSTTVTSATDDARSVFLADIDDDGDLDVLSASFGDNSVNWFENVGIDFGDAPDSYGTLLATDGARHTATGPRLGILRDNDPNGQPSADAGATGLTGDDGDGTDDEDGVVQTSHLIPGRTVTFDVLIGGAHRLAGTGSGRLVFL